MSYPDLIADIMCEGRHVLQILFLTVFKSSISAGKLVNPIPQLPRALKRNNPPGRQNHILAGSRVPSFALPFILYTELAESAYQDIITGCEG